ncbi:MAG: hypothetical protein JWO82_1106, partial [Akkermansiaceae bacterium]|nr:hypothetical protein [Akkermansiaceae bacterium]
LLESTHPAPGEAGWKPAPEMAALIYQWLLKDPGAYGDWVWADSSHSAVSARFLGVAVGEAMKVPSAIDKLLRDAGPASSSGAYSIRRAMAGELAREPDSGRLAVVKDLIPPDQWKDFCQNLSYQWPPDRREALLAFAIQQNQPGMISGLANGYQTSTPESERESSAWLIKMMDDPALPVDFRQALLADKGFGSAIAWNSSAPLALRVQFSDGATESEKYESLCRADLSRALTNSIDWPGLVRSGDATAAEVLAAATQASPELAASAPTELRDQVFAQLAVENTPAAMKLLDGLPEEDRNDAILNAIRTRFQRASPDTFLQVIQQVPADDPALWESRVDAWNSSVVWLNRNSTGDFAAWVEDLPAGPDREIALYSLARSRERSDGDTAARLRSQITDPRLLQKISEKR